MHRIGAFLLLASIASACNKPDDYGVVGGPGKSNAHEDGGGADTQSDDALCIKRHPSAVSDIEPAVLSRALDDCESDDRVCEPSPTCIGTAEDRICDAYQFIGAEAALCIARAAGLQPGLRGLDAQLGYDFSYRRVVWGVRNVLHDVAVSGPTPTGGTAMSIDAVSGEVLETRDWLLAP